MRVRVWPNVSRPRRESKEQTRVCEVGVVIAVLMFDTNVLFLTYFNVHRMVNFLRTEENVKEHAK